MNPRRKVFLQQAILPPYRIPFFQRLSGSSYLDVTMSYGEAVPSTSLRSVFDVPGVRRAPVSNFFVGGAPAMTWQHGIVRNFTSGGYDTLICSYDPRIVTNFLLILAARRRGAKVMLWGHGLRPRKRFRNLYRKLGEWANAIIFYTPQGKREAIENGLNANKLFVAWNSIDTERIAALRDLSPLAARSGIGCIGRLIPEKKVDLLLRSFQQAKGLEHDRLVIIGTGREEGALKALANELQISNRVDWVGETYEESQIAAQLNRCWVTTSPGYVGLSAIHSLAYGVPLVYGDTEPHSPEIEALEDGKNALPFTAGDPAAFARLLTTLRADPERLAQLQTAAFESAQQFSVGHMVVSFERAVAWVHGDAVPALG